jgi:hypothetical protein
MPYNFSALTHLSAIIPVSAGIKSEDKPRVEKIIPKSEPDHFLVWKQYTPIVISHAPHTKNCIKLINVNRNLILISFSICSIRGILILRSIKIARKNDSQRKTYFLLILCVVVKNML